MKRAIFLLLIAVGVSASVLTGNYNTPRPGGSSTIAGGYIYQVVDSTDTVQVDTFASDTVAIDTGTNWMNYGYEVVAATKCDSCNDSVLIIVQAYTSYGLTTAKRLIDTDTFSTNPLTAGDTIWNNYYMDTMVCNYLWFTTIIKDSVILGNGYDTSSYTLRYSVLQR